MDELNKTLESATQRLAPLMAPERVGNKLENHFDAVRARTRGAVIVAHRDMNPSQGWNEGDDKMLDMVTIWLDNLKAR